MTLEPIPSSFNPDASRQSVAGDAELINTGFHFDDFELSPELTSWLRSLAPKEPIIVSIGCGLPPREPERFYELYGLEARYLGLDINESEINQAVGLAHDGWYVVSGQVMHPEFGVDDLSLASDRGQDADVVFFPHPDVFGTAVKDFFQGILRGTSQAKIKEISMWSDIFDNALMMLKKGGIAMAMCFWSKEAEIVEGYFKTNGINLVAKIESSHKRVLLIGQKQMDAEENLGTV